MPSATAIAQPAYRIAKFTQMETSSGVAFTADILKDGKKVGSVEQGGNGGSNRYFFTDRAEESAFVAFGQEQFPGVEGEDMFVERLITAFEFSRKRAVLFVFDGDGDPFETGAVRKAGAGMTFEQVKTALAQQKADRNPRVFDKTVMDFVPVI